MTYEQYNPNPIHLTLRSNYERTGMLPLMYSSTWTNRSKPGTRAKLFKEFII